MTTMNNSTGEVVINDNVEITGTLDVQGGDITLQNDETISNGYNGVITYTATTHVFSGNEEVTGSLDVQGGNITMQNDETLDNSYNGTITATVGATGAFAVDTGNLQVGAGTPSLTLNGGDVYAAGTGEFDGLLRADAGATVSAGDLTISNGLFLPDAVDLLINDGDWLTPTVGTVYNLDSAGWVTMTLGACTEPQFLYLAGDDNFNIFINDVNIYTSDGNGVTIGQYDVVGWMCIDDEWLELFLIANS